MTEIYVSTDVETDGPIPGVNSMLSLASAAFTLDGGMIDSYSCNLELHEGAKQDPDTMKWWATQGNTYEETRKETAHPNDAMFNYSQWVSSLPGKPVFVGYPAGFDFLFVYWYLIYYNGYSPFSFSALDVKTFAMAQMKSEYRKSTKKHMPKRWFSDKPHTHIALDDAIEQGELFMNILRENREK